MVEFVTSMDRHLDSKLAQAVHELVGKAVRDANAKYKTYPDATIEAFIYGYRPENMRTLNRPPVISVFAYEGERLIGTGFLGH